MSASEPDPHQVLSDLENLPQEQRALFLSFEEMRLEFLRRRNRANTIMVVGLAMGAIIGLLLMGREPMLGLFVGGIAMVISLAIRYIMLGNSASLYQHQFKTKLFAEVTRRMAPRIDYQPEMFRSETDLKATGLISSRIDRYNGQDHFSGIYGNTQLLFSEVHAERRDTSTDSKGNTETHWVTIFRGIFLSADFHKHFQGQVLIEPDIAEAAFGWLGRKMQNLGGDLVRLENPEFEKAFKVRATDQVEARYLLTPTMQERLLELRQTWGRGLQVSLSAGWVHLLIPKTNDWFECQFENAAHDVRQLQNFAHELLRVLEIIEGLDLQTRLWTKE